MCAFSCVGRLPRPRETPTTCACLVFWWHESRCAVSNIIVIYQDHRWQNLARKRAGSLNIWQGSTSQISASRSSTRGRKTAPCTLHCPLLCPEQTLNPQLSSPIKHVSTLFNVQCATTQAQQSESLKSCAAMLLNAKTQIPSQLKALLLLSDSMSARAAFEGPSAHPQRVIWGTDVAWGQAP
jgi:hypothetical protein